MDPLKPLLREIKATAGGMLPLLVYERLYASAAEIGGGTLVEIGTAQGAATIVLAEAAKASGLPFRIYTADPFDRGTRRAIGSVEENVALVRDGFDRFGVSEDIELVVGTAAGLVAQTNPTDIRLLLLDADGQIDRDLALLYDRLAPGAVVAIDDVDDRVYLTELDGQWVLDQKHRLSHLLCTALCERGFLIPLETVCQTGFYRKGGVSPTPEVWSAMALDAYRKLVFASVEPSQVGLAAWLRRSTAQRVPSLLRLYPRLRYPDL